MREMTQRQQELARKQREHALAEAKKREALRRAEEAARLAQEKRLAEIKRKRYEAIIAAARQRVEVLTDDPNTIKASHIASLGAAAVGLQSRGPANASTSIGKNLELDRLRLGLEWKAINGAHEYKIEIFKNGLAVEQQQVQEPRYDFVLRELDPSIRYSYRVSTDLPDGRHVASPTTPIQIEVSPPRPVQPADRSQVSKGSAIIFSWAKTVLTDQYEFELALDPEFKIIVQRNSQSNNFLPFVVPQKGIFYWRVRGLTSKFTSNWSTPAQLTAR